MDHPLDLERAAGLEALFMERLGARLKRAEGLFDPLTGAKVSGSVRRDDDFPVDFGREVGRVLAAAAIYDDEVKRRLPRGARGLWEVRSGPPLLRRTRLTVFGAVLHPWAELAARRRPEPRSAAAARRFLPRDVEGPLVAVVLGTGGWRPEEEADESADVALYLVEPAAGGGFRVAAGPAEVLPPFLAVESEDEMAGRVRRYVAEARVELVLSGLAGDVVSRRTGVPEVTVREVFRTAAREEEFLRAVEENGTTVLRRS